MPYVRGIFTKEELNKFENGIDIGGYITADAQIKVLEERKNKTLVGNNNSWRKE